MIRSPLGLRLHSDRPIREQMRQAATLGAKGVVLDAVGDFSPDQLGETARREVRHLLRSVELSLVALCLPTRRPFDTTDGLEDRLAKADRALELAHALGTNLVLARVGPIPSDEEVLKKVAMRTAVTELGNLADHRGVSFTVETGTESGKVLGDFLQGLGLPTLAASVDPARLLSAGLDPIEAVTSLGPLVRHAYASDPRTIGRPSVITTTRNQGFPPGSLDWEAFLGCLEEVNYRGFLTVPADPNVDPAKMFGTVMDRVKDF